jgi:hypothetical protein
MAACGHRVFEVVHAAVASAQATLVRDADDDVDGAPAASAVGEAAGACEEEVSLPSLTNPGLLGSFLWYWPGLCHCRFRRSLQGPKSSHFFLRLVPA